MYQQNMTGDPNQETRPSIFGFETYPSQNAPSIDWTRIPMASPMHFIPQGQFNPALQYGDIQDPQMNLGNFSFCTTQTPHPAQFPFPNSLLVGDGTSVPLRCKRKTDSPPPPSTKQHITEEKMAEHMSRLHISSETASSKENETTRTQRLYMCEEMRKLQRDSILPHSLLTQIQRPCQALVLWTPPRRLVDLGNPNENNNEQNNDNQMDFDV